MVPTSKSANTSAERTCSSSDMMSMVLTKLENNSWKVRENILEEDFQEFGTPLSPDSSEILALSTHN